MQTATMDFTINDLRDTLLKVEGLAAREMSVSNHLPKLGFFAFLRGPLTFVDTYFARKFERVSARLVNICLNFNSTISRIRLGDFDGAIDPDFTTQEALERAKDVVRGVRAQVIELRTKAKLTWSPGRLIKSLDTLCNIAEEAYTAANHLQWEIAEHDLAFLPRKAGYVAHSAEESDQLLDRILAEG